MVTRLESCWSVGFVTSVMTFCLPLSFPERRANSHKPANALCRIRASSPPRIPATDVPNSRSYSLFSRGCSLLSPQITSLKLQHQLNASESVHKKQAADEPVTRAGAGEPATCCNWASPFPKRDKERPRCRLICCQDRAFSFISTYSRPILSASMGSIFSRAAGNNFCSSSRIW